MPLTREEIISILRADDQQRQADVITGQVPSEEMTREEIIQTLREKDRKLASQEPTILDQYGDTYIKPIAEGVGMGLGGVAGLGLGPIGTVAGAGLGYGLGRQAYRLTKEALQGGEAQPALDELDQAAGSVLEGATGEMGGQFLGKAITAIGPTTKKLASSIYKVPENAIDIYAKNPEAVEKAAFETPYQMGQNLIDDISGKIKTKSGNYNAHLDEALLNASNVGKSVTIQSTIDDLKNSLENIKPVTEQALREREEIQRQVDLLNEYRKIKGAVRSNLDPVEANDIKRRLQAASKYQDGKLVYNRGDEAGKAFKSAAAQLRQDIETQVPEVVDWNKKLSDILDFETDPKFTSAFKESNIENTMKNLQSEGGNKGYLREIAEKADSTLGTNIVKDTENTFAAKYFGNPDFISNYQTGRSTWPAIVGGTVGGAVGGAVGGPVGAAIGGGIGTASGAFLGSPKLLKAAIPPLSSMSNAVNKVGETALMKASIPASKYEVTIPSLEAITNALRTNPQVLGPYAGQLDQAANKSQEALGATHFVLYNQDPNYRERLNSITKERDLSSEGQR